MAAAFAFAVDDFFIGKNGSKRRTPVYRDFIYISETFFVKL
jgi:hypothetical protein